MQAKHRPLTSPVIAAATADDTPSRYWGLVLLAACTASWVAIFAVAKLVLALI
jgi:hypothetical protein